jgi:hypothetical protein
MSKVTFKTKEENIAQHKDLINPRLLENGFWFPLTQEEVDIIVPLERRNAFIRQVAIEVNRIAERAARPAEQQQDNKVGTKLTKAKHYDRSA